MIYTIGNRKSYQEALAEATFGKAVKKVGRRDDYSGGYALRSMNDALRLIEELGCPEYGVFGIMADWDKDTEPADDGWWRYLLVDARIVDIGS